MTHYRVKVRARTFLWGGDGVTKSFDFRLLLSFRVDEDGEAIEVTLLRPQGSAPETLGKLNPGEAFTVPLDGLTGVLAECNHDSYVDCYLTTFTP